MNWKLSPPIIETAAIWTAATCLGSAVAFAVTRLAPLGAGWGHAAVAGAFVALVGGILAGHLDRRRGVRRSFATAGIPTVLEDGDEVAAPDDVLLLDDPLPPIDDGSRVVRLFAAQPATDIASAPLVAPGEMAARIEDFLGRPRAGEAIARAQSGSAAEDASAALHAALADIRRSLRHG